MQQTSPVTIGIFDDSTQAQHAINELKRSGFTEREIGVTARHGDGDGAAHDEKGGTHAKEGAVAGLATGAGVGTLWGLGVLAGVVPGIGTAIAGGTLAALVSSAAAGAATAGLAGTLIGLGVREDDAEEYDKEFRAGRAIVTVKANGRTPQAMSILRQNGAHDLSTRHDGASTGMPASSAAARPPTGQTIEAREEQLRVSKRPVQTGEVDVRKEVRTERQSIEVPVRKEEVVIERHAVGDRPAQGAIGDDQEMRIPVSEERVDVEKHPVVTEEVSVGKRTAESTERVSANTRKEEIKVDQRGRPNVRTKPQ